MDFQLIWTDSAIADLRGIVAHYVHEAKTPAAAAKIGSAILARAEILTSFPDIGPRYPRTDGTYREIQCGNYQIFYRVERQMKQIFIARIWHTSRDPEALTS